MNFTEEQIEKIREALLFVTEFKGTLEKPQAALVLGKNIVSQYGNYINNFNVLVPGILDKFICADHISEYDPSFGDYSSESVLMRVKEDFAILKTKVNDVTTSPDIPTKDLSFVTDSNLRSIVKRDYAYLGKCSAVKAWKPVIILAGGLIEALLLDKLSTDETKARASSKAPKENDLKKWNLDDLIDVAVDLKYINIGVEKLSDAVRHYRNLVHPGNELRSGLKIEPEEAKIAIEVLNMIIRDLQNP